MFPFSCLAPRTFGALALRYIASFPTALPQYLHKSRYPLERTPPSIPTASSLHLIALIPYSPYPQIITSKIIFNSLNDACLLFQSHSMLNFVLYFIDCILTIKFDLIILSSRYFYNTLIFFAIHPSLLFYLLFHVFLCNISHLSLHGTLFPRHFHPHRFIAVVLYNTHPCPFLTFFSSYLSLLCTLA